MCWHNHATLVTRTQAEVTRFLDGFDLVELGVVFLGRRGIRARISREDHLATVTRQALDCVPIPGGCSAPGDSVYGAMPGTRLTMPGLFHKCGASGPTAPHSGHDYPRALPVSTRRATLPVNECA